MLDPNLMKKSPLTPCSQDRREGLVYDQPGQARSPRFFGSRDRASEGIVRWFLDQIGLPGATFGLLRYPNTRYLKPEDLVIAEKRLPYA